MAACEKCWNDAYGRSISDTSKTQAVHYRDLLEERKDDPCPPRCSYCGVRPVDAAGRSCTECDDMLAGCDPGNE